MCENAEGGPQRPPCLLSGFLVPIDLAPNGRSCGQHAGNLHAVNAG